VSDCEQKAEVSRLCERYGVPRKSEQRVDETKDERKRKNDEVRSLLFRAFHDRDENRGKFAALSSQGRKFVGRNDICIDE
jgi:hypothetical protein